MNLRFLAAFATLATVSAAQAQAPVRPQGSAVRICGDVAHGQAPLDDRYAAIAAKLGGEITPLATPITAASLERCRVLVMSLPVLEVTPDESTAIADFVRTGRSLLLAFDEERRAPLVTTRVNDIIAPFGMQLTTDTEYLHNTGAIAKRGMINAGIARYLSAAAGPSKAESRSLGS